jgi:hypothetical protein
MIDSIRSYYPEGCKTFMEREVMEKNLFTEASINRNLISEKDEYPIKASYNGISIEIDKYRFYVNTKYLIIYNNSNERRINKYRNLKFSDFQNCLKQVNDFLPKYSRNLISSIKISFVIPTEYYGRDIIKENIISHGYKYYNHNKKFNSIDEVKEFEFSDFKFAFYADKKEKNENYLRIVYTIKKAHFKKAQVKHPNDLSEKQKLEIVFGLFLKRFDNFIIVDNFHDVKEGDSLLLKDFLTYRYWEELDKQKTRQTKHRKMKLFKNLIAENKLDKIKKSIRENLIKAYHEFIKN